MAEKLDYTIQIDTTEYDITAADSLHADLANQVEKALIVKKSVRKDLDDIRDNASLIIDTKTDKNNLRADIGAPSEVIGVDMDAEGNPKLDNKGNPIPIDRNATNAFAFKGDSKAEIEIVPSSGGVFTGPIYAPDINAGDGFNVNKFQVTNYNSVDTIIRELKGFPVYKWTGTHVLALTKGAPPTMLPFKVIIYTGPTSGDTTDYWTEAHRADLRLVNGNPDGTTTDCTTDGKFFLINAKAGHSDCGRILLGTFDHTKKTNCSTYEELRVAEADHADDATNVTHSIGNMPLNTIFVYDNNSDKLVISPKVLNAANADVAGKLGTADKGTQTKPIYLNGGVATECLQYAGGTLVELNGTEKQAQTAKFFAPITAGQTTQVLIGKGSNDVPSWTNISGLSVLEAKTADEAGTVTTNIKNQSITNIFKAASSGTGISAVVKNADISDKLSIRPVGGTASNAEVSSANSSGNYILYGRNEPPSNGKTDSDDDILLRRGNIYIKIEP